jgi:hypothetical protein
LFCFYQIGHALEDAQDLRVTQPVVGKVKDAKFGALPEVLDVFHSLQVVVRHLQCVQDWEAGWNGMAAGVSNTLIE